MNTMESEEERQEGGGCRIYGTVVSSYLYSHRAKTHTLVQKSPSVQSKAQPLHWMPSAEISKPDQW